MLKNYSQYKTPCYIYKKSELLKQINEIKAVFPETQLYYSAKANSHTDIMRTVQENGLNVDVASCGELRRAIEVGFSSENISYIGPGKSIEDLKFAILCNVGEIVVESVEEIKRIIKLNKELIKKQKILIRVNPNLEVMNSSLTMGGRASQFGIDETEVDETILKFKESIEIVGVHFFFRSQIFKIKELIQQFETSISLANSIQERNSINFRRVNIGGGIPIAYYDSQENIDMAQLKKEYNLLLQKHSLSYKVSIESGRFISGPTGYFLTKVEYLKRSRTKNFVITDGGFSNNSSLVGVGQVLKQNFKCTTSSKEKEVLVYSVAGPSCTPFDILLQNMELPKLHTGDYICFQNCGAYGLSYSPSNFLLLKEAVEYFIE
ncbi:MAG: diaminopimelate decarboxylase [Bacteriovoracaceae bacterium]|jgi:diaminopimelate decarboxylase